VNTSVQFEWRSCHLFVWKTWTRAGNLLAVRKLTERLESANKCGENSVRKNY